MNLHVQCFKCRNIFHDTNELFVHIKEFHKICGKSKYTCTCACTEIFNEFGTYKAHVRRCFYKIVVDDEEAAADRAELIEAYNDVAMPDEDVQNFKDSAEREAFLLACKLNAIMILPRDLVYKTIKDFAQYLQNVVVEGMKRIVIPRVPGPEKTAVKDFGNVIVSSFSQFATEWKFDKALSDAGLIVPFDRCVISADIPDKPNTLHNSEDEENISNETAVLMPISFQIKKFFELPGVFKKMIENAANIQRNGKLNHFINGSLWKEKIKNFDENQIVVPYIYYSDGAQLNHPLGPHIRKGSEDFQYYSFPTIPTEYQSRLENIFLSYLFPEMFYKEFSLEEIFGNIIEELTKLATDGILVDVDSTVFKVFLVCGAFIADNKEANTVLGFSMSFTAIKFCRFCQMNKSAAKRATTEDLAIRRNRVNYDEEILMQDFEETGIHGYSPLNNIPFFHVTESSAGDTTHTVEEGVGKYNISDALSILIKYDKILTIEQLNRRIKDFTYAPEEKSNKPHLISKEHLDENKLKMSATETATFIQNITFMIGDLVSEDNEAWHLILNTVKFFDFCYLPCYEEEDLNEWIANIDKMHKLYYKLCDDLKPHHHLAIHFPTETRKLGPLRYMRTIRFEGKHRELKSYAKNSNNRIDLSYSIAKKVQYNFAERLLQSRAFEDIIVGNYQPGMIKEKVYYAKLQPSIHKDLLVMQKCLFTDKINVNGMQVNRGLWIPGVTDDCNRRINIIHEICDVVLITSTQINDFFVICKTYDCMPNDHFAGYEIDMLSLKSEFSIINVADFLEKHHYPVMVHKIGSKVLFRCKRF